MSFGRLVAGEAPRDDDLEAIPDGFQRANNKEYLSVVRSKQVQTGNKNADRESIMNRELSNNVVLFGLEAQE